MKLHENQLYLLRHLAQFNLLDYSGCLELLKTPVLTDPVALSYAFRPLTKNGYLSKRKDGSVSILAKGRALFPEIQPMIAMGGGETEIRRVIAVSRMAALMEKNQIPVTAQLPKTQEPCFIPSACWRNIAPGILSTTRFVGMLVGYGRRIAVYDIGNGCMDWQVRAEGSLFYTKYGSYETKATGMLLICHEEQRTTVAQNIIQQTMWNRRRLLQQKCCERNRPTRWSHAPIKLRVQYEHVYLTTAERLAEDLSVIWAEDAYINDLLDGGTRSYEPRLGDIERWPKRLFVNPATDLLKYIYFFAAVMERTAPEGMQNRYVPRLQYELYIQPQDEAILEMYPQVFQMEEVEIYLYQSEPDIE